MKLMDITSRMMGTVRILIMMNSGDGRKPHELGKFETSKIPLHLMERQVYWMIPRDNYIDIAISNSDKI